MIFLIYRKLDRKANQLAHHLRSLAIKSEIYVGLCVESNLQLIIGILGILMTIILFISVTVIQKKGEEHA